MAILVKMEKWEYAEEVAKKIIGNGWECLENENMLCDIVEHYIDDLSEVPSVINFSGNFTTNIATCFFGIEEVLDLIEETNLDLSKLVEHLNLQEEDFPFLDEKENSIETAMLKAWLEEVCQQEDLEELNDYIQSQGVDAYIIYGDSHELCAYRLN